MLKNLSGGALINYGPTLPSIAEAYDGALFYKSAGTDRGLYIFSYNPDANLSVVGEQAVQGWNTVAAAEYVYKTGDTMTGTLTLNNSNSDSSFNSGENFLILENRATTGYSGIAFVKDTAVNAQVLEIGTSVGNGRLMFSTANAGVLSERMRIDSSGNVMIGTTTTASKLTVDGGIRVLSGNIELDTGQLTSNSPTNPLIFGVSGIERMRIDSVGNVSIGATQPGWELGKSITIDGLVSLQSDSVTLRLLTNTYHNGTNWIRTTADETSIYIQGNGSHQWFSNTTGAAGGTYTPTERMRLDVSGDLNIIGGNLKLTPPAANSVGIELGWIGPGGSAPYIDFHSSGSNNDYDSRIIATGGTGANEQGILTYLAGWHTFNGNVKVGTDHTGAKLNIGGTDQAIRIIHSNGYISFMDSTNSSRTGYIQMNTNTNAVFMVEIAQDIIFGTNGAERMRIGDDGSIMVGPPGDQMNLNNFRTRNHSSNGYQDLPGGLRIQWGVTDTLSTDSGGNNISFPIAFSNVCWHVSVNPSTNYGPSGTTVNAHGFAHSYTRFGFIITNDSLASAFTWFAIGI